jgi:hypothetical protein
LLESIKDRFLEVNPPPLGQHVPPRVRCGIACLLIKKLWVCVLFESNREGCTWYPTSARGARDGETLVECKTDPKEPL